MNVPRSSYVVVALLLGLLLSPTAGAQEPMFLYETFIDGYYLASARGIVVDDDGNAFAIATWYERRWGGDFLALAETPPRGAI